MYFTIIFSLFTLTFASYALCLRPTSCLTSLLIHDGLLMVACLFCGCVFCLHHWLCSWEFQIITRHYFWQSVVQRFGNQVQSELHRNLLLWSCSISLFIRNWIAWWSPILTFIFRFTISSSVDMTKSSILFSLVVSCTCCVRLLAASIYIRLLPGAGVGLCSVQSMFGKLKSPMMIHSCCDSKISPSIV